MKFVIVIQEHSAQVHLPCPFDAISTIMRPVMCQPEGITYVHLLYTLECDDKFFHRTFTLKHEQIKSGSRHSRLHLSSSNALALYYMYMPYFIFLIKYIQFFYNILQYY